MQSNREVFQDMREQEAFENPQDIQRPVDDKPLSVGEMLERFEKEAERKYKEKYGDLPYHLNLDARADDYNAAIKRNQLAKYGDVDADFVDKFYNRDRAKLEKPIVYHHHAKPLTDVEKIYHVPGVSKQEKEVRLNKMKEGFKKLRNE